ncbi:ribbon-helix-helix domain-containing protein [Pyrobaculum neutrophilum]|uniref:Transcriptional regulator, CopG family n=1 Tax=Pyrobaculum neutrophilum (strain DSM 2338 / JCM 9278 / NBRC 100436 / V24Sta) TaxID=444157 RepID=B1YCN5_PYRNV|nr:ribbon-helix-helix domain-containing protein [Pyrobaculum neutrophilum]ACB39548.1 putative transcriptional regulator, CopG family [Pyrobaculum neutrophilum V24Sta]
MGRRRSKVPLERIAIRFPSELLMRMDKLVERGVFKNRSHLVKAAIEELLRDPKYQEALRDKDEDFPAMRGR